MTRLARCLLISAAVLTGGSTAGSTATAPRPPCDGRETQIDPAYAEVGEPPRVATWTGLDIQLPESCPATLAGRFELAVALAGRFESPESLADMAARIGAVSSMGQLKYWSVTDSEWRSLFTSVFALSEDSASRRRSDFTATEVLGGQTLYLSQDDSRSSGENVYALKTIATSPDTLLIETWNVTPIRLFVLRLFDPGSLRAVHFLQRQGSGEWRYYGLSLIRSGARPGHERSFINRAAAYYRYLAGQVSDGAPPLAP